MRQPKWFQDIKPIDYNTRIKRVRTFSVIPFVWIEDPPSGVHRPLAVPGLPLPDYEQRVAVTEVFHLLKATPPQPQGVVGPGPELQINVVVQNLSTTAPVAYQVYMAETDN